MRRLFHLPLSPFCRKVRLVLAEKRIEFELVEELPWDRRIDFLRLNPAGAVPVFIDDEGAVFSESNAICEYLEETGPEPRLLPSDAVDRAEARRLVAWFDDKFHREVTVNLVYERVNKRLMKAGYPDSAFVKAGSKNVKYHLEYIGWLIDGRNWLAGDQLSLADFAAASHLSCLDYSGDVPWDIAPAAKEWYARVKSRPAFRMLLSDHIPGMPPKPHYADLDF
ncbi:MAG: glutathione S-transferase family protein [Pseudomonadota bacterium]